MNPEIDVLGAVLFGMGATATARRRFAKEDVRNVLGDADLLCDSVIRHAEAAADDAREKGRLIHELAEGVPNADAHLKALTEGPRPRRNAGRAPPLDGAPRP